MVLCTDDCGVFGTSLSREYALAATAFKLSTEQLCALALGAADAAFLPDAEKKELKQRMEAGVEAVQLRGS